MSDQSVSNKSSARQAQVAAMLAERVPSPCVGICKLDADNECLGCARTLAEIVDWGVMDEEQKHQVLERIERAYPR